MLAKAMIPLPQVSFSNVIKEERSLYLFYYFMFFNCKNFYTIYFDHVSPFSNSSQSSSTPNYKLFFLSFFRNKETNKETPPPKKKHGNLKQKSKRPIRPKIAKKEKVDKSLQKYSWLHLVLISYYSQVWVYSGMWVIYQMRLHWRKLIFLIANRCQLQRASDFGVWACVHYSFSMLGCPLAWTYAGLIHAATVSMNSYVHPSSYTWLSLALTPSISPST